MGLRTHCKWGEASCRPKVCVLCAVHAGQKFPSKTLEMSLQATLYFPDHPPPASPEVQEDPFCVGLNSYADVSPFPVCP